MRRAHRAHDSLTMKRWRVQRRVDALSVGPPALKPEDAGPIVKVNAAHTATVKRCKVSPFRLYDLRHTWAAMAGVDLSLHSPRCSGTHAFEWFCVMCIRPKSISLQQWRRFSATRRRSESKLISCFNNHAGASSRTPSISRGPLTERLPCDTRGSHH